MIDETYEVISRISKTFQDAPLPENALELQPPEFIDALAYHVAFEEMMEETVIPNLCGPFGRIMP